LAAARAFEAAAIADPRGRDAVRWAWLLAARRCDRTAVTRWRELGSILNGGDLYVPIHLGKVPNVESPGQLERYPRAMWHMEGPGQGGQGRGDEGDAGPGSGGAQALDRAGSATGQWPESIRKAGHSGKAIIDPLFV